MHETRAHASPPRSSGSKTQPAILKAAKDHAAEAAKGKEEDKGVRAQRGSQARLLRLRRHLKGARRAGRGWRRARSLLRKELRAQARAWGAGSAVQRRAVRARGA